MANGGGNFQATNGGNSGQETNNCGHFQRADIGRRSQKTNYYRFWQVYMTIVLPTKAKEGSTYIVTVSFKDEDGEAETPTAITWTLTDSDGTVINSREDVSVSPASTINIVLSGDDLQIVSENVSSPTRRVLTIEAVYNSTLGNNLPLKEQIEFNIDNLVVVV